MGDAPRHVDQYGPAANADRQAVPERYPENLMEFAPTATPELEHQFRAFFDLREQVLLDYSHNTARGYYTDLQDIFEWAVARGKDVLALTDKDIRQYCALLRRRKYSESTIRRRVVAWRKLQCSSLD